MVLKILLADSNVTAQNAGRKILASAGHDVLTVSNGVAAVKKIAEVHPDVVLLDVYLAGRTGVEVCQQVKATAGLAQTPVLLTVGKMEPFGAGEAIKVKADGLITKPFDIANLITIVEKLTGGSTSPHSPAAPPTNLDGLQPAVKATVKAQPRSETSPARGESSPARSGKEPLKSPPVGELCDVCGHRNRLAVFACERCDVPLPSSVSAPSQ